MDASKRMGRPAGDYISRGLDPSSVPVARLQKEADTFYRAPNQAVPNNTMVGRGVQMEVARDNQQVYGNTYGDWRAQGVPSTGVDLALVKPGVPQQALLTQPEQANERFDYEEGQRFMAQQLPSPLDQPPPAALQNQGLAMAVARDPASGRPIGQPLPPTPPVEIEDLRFVAPLIEGSSADALFPQVEAPTFDLSKGKPARMPKAKGR